MKLGMCDQAMKFCEEKIYLSVTKTFFGFEAKKSHFPMILIRKGNEINLITFFNTSSLLLLATTFLLQYLIHWI